MGGHDLINSDQTSAVHPICTAQHLHPALIKLDLLSSTTDQSLAAAATEAGRIRS